MFRDERGQIALKVNGHHPYENLQWVSKRDQQLLKLLIETILFQIVAERATQALDFEHGEPLKTPCSLDGERLMLYLYYRAKCLLNASDPSGLAFVSAHLWFHHILRLMHSLHPLCAAEQHPG